MKGARTAVLGAAAGVLLVSSAVAGEPRRLGAQYFYDRALAVEVVFLDAIRDNKPRRLMTLHVALLDEIDLLSGNPSVVNEGGKCAWLLASLAAVAGIAHEHVERRTAPTNMANHAWADYRKALSRCEAEPGLSVSGRALPEKLSEVF